MVSIGHYDISQLLPTIQKPQYQLDYAIYANSNSENTQLIAHTQATEVPAFSDINSSSTTQFNQTCSSLMFPSETVLSGGTHPGTTLTVLKSNAGWYVGFKDKNGAPYSRESRYFNTQKGAISLLGAMRH